MDVPPVPLVGNPGVRRECRGSSGSAAWMQRRRAALLNPRGQRCVDRLAQKYVMLEFPAPPPGEGGHYQRPKPAALAAATPPVGRPSCPSAEAALQPYLRQFLPTWAVHAGFP